MNKPLVRILLLALVVGGGYFGYQYWRGGGSPSISQLPEVGETFENLPGSVAGYSIDLDSLRESGTEQLKTLTERAGELSGQTRSFIDTAPTVQPGAESGETKPFHQTAAEYGQYLYCKQVVESYESLQKVQNEAESEN